MTNGRKKLYQWPVYRNSSTFFHKYSDQNLQVFPILPTHILFIFNKYGVQQIYFTFSTNIFNNGCLVWQTGIKYTSGLLMQQFYLSQQTFRLLVVQAISLKLESVFPTYTQEIYLIFSTNTFNNCLVGVTNGSEDEIYQGTIQATEKMHLLCKSFSQKTLNRKER